MIKRVADKLRKDKTEKESMKKINSQKRLSKGWFHLQGASLGGHFSHSLAKFSHGCSSVTGVRELQEDFISRLGLLVTEIKMSITSDPAGELHVLDLDGTALGMDGTQVSVLKDTYNVGFSCLLQGNKGLRLEAHLSTTGLSCDLSDKSLERCTGKQIVKGLLVPLDLAKSASSSLQSELPLHATCSWCCLLGHLSLRSHRLDGDLLLGGFGDLLSSSFDLGHFELE